MFKTFVIAALLFSACNTTDNPQWQDYNTTSIERLTSEGKTVFVQYTADWCTTCLSQEKNILHSEQMKTLFKNKKVVLVKADWTEYSASIDKDIIANGQTGIPMYIVYSDKNNFNGKTLPELIKQKDISTNL